MKFYSNRKTSFKEEFNSGGELPIYTIP
jgi:hypothetical protein